MEDDTATTNEYMLLLCSNNKMQDKDNAADKIGSAEIMLATNRTKLF